MHKRDYAVARRGRADASARLSRLVDSLLTQGTAASPGVALQLGVGLVLCWLLGILLGGASHVAPHWFYLPIIVAALRLGWTGALLTSVLAVALAGPLLPGDVTHWVPQDVSDWASRGVFFVVLGQVYAWLFARLRAAFDRELTLLGDQRDAALADSAARQVLEEKLRRQAFHDALTGLANRALLHDRLEHALRRAQRELTSHALLFLDLDDFKTVNDTLGHAAGDTLLQAVAARLHDCVRPGDTIARLGGDEFAVLLEDTDGDRATQACARLTEVLRAPFTVAGREIVTGSSIGVALSATAQDADGLLRAADAAMYAAKRSGKGRWALYQEGMHATLVEQFELKQDLEHAIATEDIAVHYQPVVALNSGTIVGVEALARWIHPTRGLINPATFIPLAEEMGLIGALDQLVLRRACAQVAAWHDGGLPALRLAVNLSGHTLQAPHIVATIARTVRESGVVPGQLELELTETVAVSEDAGTLSVLGAIQDLGVRLALDDFGTGYSILRRLHRLPFTTLKIDRSFLQERPGAHRSGLVPLVIDLGHSLGLEVVAEGVETLDQARLLQENGCEYAQGYAFSRPVVADAVAYLVQQGHGLEAPPMHEVTRPLLAELERLTGLESTYLTRIDWARQEQEISVAHNSGTLTIPEGLRVAWADTLCRRALEGGPRYTSDVQATYPDSQAAQALGLRTYISVPVLGPTHEVIGTLCGASTAAVELGESALTVMEQFATHIGDRMAGAAA